MNKLSFFFVTASVAMLVACGGSSSSSDSNGGGGSGTGTASDPNDPNPPPSDASPCVKATHELCVRACGCNTSGSGKCVVAYGGGVVTEEHDSMTDCENFYSIFVCAQPAASDYTDACGTALQSASCLTTKEKGDALDYPAACKSPSK